MNFATAPQEGTCSCCGTTTAVVSFQVLLEGLEGAAAPICQRCLFGGEGISVDLDLYELAPERASRKRGLRDRKKHSRKQEEEIATLLGARRQPGSGAFAHAKGDVRKKGEFRLEAKFTESDSFSLKLEELQKIALECGPFEKPVFTIDFLEKGTRVLKERFAVLPFEDLQEKVNGPSKNR